MTKPMPLCLLCAQPMTEEEMDFYPGTMWWCRNSDCSNLTRQKVISKAKPFTEKEVKLWLKLIASSGYYPLNRATATIDSLYRKVAALEEEQAYRHRLEKNDPGLVDQMTKAIESADWISAPDVEVAQLSSGEGGDVAWNRRLSEWIPCSERMPKNLRKVLVRQTNKFLPIHAEMYFHEETDIWWMSQIQVPKQDVTHWMPIPPLPEEN